MVWIQQIWITLSCDLIINAKWNNAIWLFQSTLYGEEKPDSSPESFFLHKLVDLVDKYWNGTKSLHNHSKFKGIHCFLSASILYIFIHFNTKATHWATGIHKVRRNEVSNSSNHIHSGADWEYFGSRTTWNPGTLMLIRLSHVTWWTCIISCLAS